MGNLKPGATYIYERVDGIIYAREPLSTERIEMGRTADRVIKDQLDWDLWKEIVEQSKFHPALQSELERVKIFYLLMKGNGVEIQHHPV
jgi:hypothetical protein